MKVQHRLGPFTEIPDGAPPELATLLRQCEDPRGRWMFVGAENPQDSQCYYAIGTAPDGAPVDVDFARKPPGAISGKWEPTKVWRPTRWQRFKDWLFCLWHIADPETWPDKY